MLCQYRDIFGKVGEGVHSYRFAGIAIVDTILTILLAYAIAFFTGCNFWKILIITFIGGILIHRLFCVRTTIDKLLFS